MNPRRSVLYMPGANERALEKAKTLDADGLILDLEDAVAPDAKEAARERVCAAASSKEYGSREVTIRVNGLDTEWHDADLRAAAQAGPDAIVVPKVNSAAEVHNIERALELGGAPDHTKIWARARTRSWWSAGASGRWTGAGTSALRGPTSGSPTPGS